MFSTEVWGLPGQKERFPLLRLTICLSLFSQSYWQYSTGRFAVLNLLHYSSQSSFLTTSDWGTESSNVALRKTISKHCSDPASVFWLLSFMTLLTKNSRLSFTKLPMNAVDHCILDLSLNDTDYFGIQAENNQISEITWCQYPKWYSWLYYFEV